MLCVQSQTASRQTFFVIMGDVILEGFLDTLAGLHRVNDASVTMLLQDTNQRRKGIDGVNFIATSDGDQRVLMMVNDADLDDQELVVPKALLRRRPNLSITTTVNDLRTYVFARWVMDLIVERAEEVSGITEDLIPLMLSMQFRGCDDLSDDLALQARARVPATGTLTEAGVSAAAGGTMSEDVVKCHCVMLQPEAKYAARVTSIEDYINMNNFIARYHGERGVTPWTVENNRDFAKLRKQGCVVGKEVILSGKASIKRTMLGSHCRIGDNAKLANCIIMDHVVLGAGVKLKNCIVCPNSIIGARCNLENCKIGPGTQLEEAQHLDGETLSSSSVAWD